MLRRLKRLKYITSPIGKFKFLLATILSHANDLCHSNILTNLQNSLARGVVVRYMNSYFVVPDYHAIRFLDPSHEAWFWNYVTIEEGDVVVDVGAHIGKYSITLGKTVGPRGLVIAIEPHPINFYFLFLNARINNVTDIVNPYNVATWNQDDITINLYISLESHLHSAVLKHRGEQGSIRVKTRTVDSIVRELGLSKVDLIKIDVEGAEIEVIEGAMNILQRFAPTMVAEVFRFNLKRFVKVLRDLHYEVYPIKEALSDKQAYVIAEPKS